MLQLEMMSEKYLPWALHQAFLGHYNDSSMYSFRILNNAVLMFGIFLPSGILLPKPWFPF